jgi:two-component system, chemotaxis family, response regulator Rcp1
MIPEMMNGGDPSEAQILPWGSVFKQRGENRAGARPLEILVVEDNPADVGLLRMAFREWKTEVRLTVIGDGEKALLHLREARNRGTALPDLILLDLDLPVRTGIEVLSTVKGDPGLQQIPTVVLTSSQKNEDVSKAYNLHANCYVTKAVDVFEYFAKMRALEEFWLSTVRLPSVGESI